MLSLALLLALQEPAAAVSPDAAAIQAACKKLAEAENYTVLQTSQDTGGGFGGPGGAPGGAAGGEGQAPPPPPAPTVFTMHVQNGKPAHFMMGDLEAWRDKGVLVHRKPGGAWERFDMPQRGGPGGGGQGGRGGDPEAQRAMRTRMSLATTQTASEMLAAFETKIAVVSAAQEGGKTVYTGTLTPEGAASLGMGGRGFRGGRGGQGGGAQGGGGAPGGGPPPFESSGSFRIVVAGGVLESVTLDTVTKGSFNDQAFERKRHLEIAISALGKTAIPVPDEVTAKFAAKPEESLEF